MMQTLDEAAEAFKDKYEKEINTYPFTIVGAAYHEGAQWAVANDPRVRKLIEALEAISRARSVSYKGRAIQSDARNVEKIAEFALAAFRKEIGG